jgi:hypothetical protein
VVDRAEQNRSAAWAVCASLFVGLTVGLAPPIAAEPESAAREVMIPRVSQDALVIGNAAYLNSPLRNPSNDASDMASLLGDLGFDVQLVQDATQREMEDAIRAFGQRLTGESVGLFYYAGHGMQVEGQNYLIPIGARIVSRKDAKYKAVDLGQLLDELALAESRLNIVILDACRDNPFAGFRGGTRGLARADAPTGTIIAYATAPGSVAADGDGRNGIYTHNLMDSMRQPGLSIERVLKRTRIGVLQETNGLQTPWDSSSLTGDFFFNPVGMGVAVSAPPPSLTMGVAPVPRPRFPHPRLGANDPADEARRALRAYEEAYEAEDLDRLGEIWVMNPSQRRSVDDLFKCADEISMDVETGEVEVSGGIVSIGFAQRLAFSGPECLMKESPQRTRMTATLLERQPGEWVISSILPHRE